jgi:DNA ligase 1
MKVMLVSDYNKAKLTPPLFAQPKMDGIRAYMKWNEDRTNVTIASRNNVILSKKTLHHLLDAMSAVPTSMILDGELYKHGWPLQRIMGAVNRDTPNEDSGKISFNVFDCLLRDRKQADFAARLMAIRLVAFPLNTQVYQAYTQHLESYFEVEQFHLMSLNKGYEGTIIRHGRNEYMQGKRSPEVMRIKDFKDEDCPITGIQEGKGKYEGSTGAFELTFPGTDKPFTAGSGLTDVQRDQLWEQRDGISGTVKVKYEKLSEGGTPLKPTVLCYEIL